MIDTTGGERGTPADPAPGRRRAAKPWVAVLEARRNVTDPIPRQTFESATGTLSPAASGAQPYAWTTAGLCCTIDTALRQAGWHGWE